jgi:hypothetical protein
MTSFKKYRKIIFTVLVSTGVIIIILYLKKLINQSIQNKYSCDKSNNQCVEDVNGDYSTPDCDGTCNTHSSPCFDESIDAGISLIDQKKYTFSVKSPNDNNTYNTCLQVANGSSDKTIWINWLVFEEADDINDSNFYSAWKDALNNPQQQGYTPQNQWAWMNDNSHPEGWFELPPNKYVLLPYMGTSGRVAGALGCENTGDSDLGNPIIMCDVGQGGAPSPQTLIEWTWTPAGPDVIDCSTVDGYSLPVRLEYLKENGTHQNILGKFTEDKCSKGGFPIKIGQKYVGCKSPCSHTNDEQECCAGEYDKPDTCHPNGVPVSQLIEPWCNSITAMFSYNNKRIGYCYAYDDEAGTINDHEKYNSIVKVTFCTDGFS